LHEERGRRTLQPLGDGEGGILEISAAGGNGRRMLENAS